MSIQFNCPTCKKTLKAPDEKAGAKVACPGCKTILQIPSPEAVESDGIEEVTPVPSPAKSRRREQENDGEEDSPRRGKAAATPNKKLWFILGGAGAVFLFAAADQ